MALFAIADLHLSLGNKEKAMDVFPGWENYTRRLKENWDKLVGPQDTVVIAGDISWAMKLEETEADFSFLHERPGKKLLFKGNHDYWWSTRAKMERYFESMGLDDLEILHNSAYPVGEYAVCGTRGWMYNAASAEDLKIVNREAGRLNASLLEAEKLMKKPLVFLHYPPVYDNFVCEEILEVLHSHSIDTCYFGHIHGQQAVKRAYTGLFQGIDMRLIACDSLRFCPVMAAK